MTKTLMLFSTVLAERFRASFQEFNKKKVDMSAVSSTAADRVLDELGINVQELTLDPQVSPPTLLA
jgi:repressor of nif and glnA expression